MFSWEHRHLANIRLKKRKLKPFQVEYFLPYYNCGQKILIENFDFYHHSKLCLKRKQTDDMLLEVVSSKESALEIQMDKVWPVFLVIVWLNTEQDGRLAPAYFSPNYKYFDQLFQTVRKKTSVLILVLKDFLQTSIRPLISVLYAKGYHDYPWKNFCLTGKISSGSRFVFQKISGTEKC